jgi:Restriction endonuclease
MRQGRDLEDLVSRIKDLLHGDAMIDSPFTVLDVDTGSPREVDVGVRFDREGTEVFIAVECRDRSGAEDVTWIEQLISKKQSIAADLIIAVTSDRFTRPALMKAAKHGVVVRQLNESLAAEIQAVSREAYVELRALKVASTDPLLELRVPHWRRPYISVRERSKRLRDGERRAHNSHNRTIIQ